MKKLLAAIGQFLLFLIVDVVGSLVYHPFHVRTKLAGNPLEPRMYVWDGVLLMLAVYFLLLLIAALRKRVGAWLPWATVALVLAAVAGYGLKLGFVTQNW
jgi:phosphoglycerol transferase MdoB-like AlkP superfamily enzyme